MDLKTRISEAFESELARIYDDEGITTGDITPEQLQQWENITTAAAELFAALIEQNKQLIVYDGITAELCRELVDVLTPQETADAIGKPIRSGSTIYHPSKC